MKRLAVLAAVVVAGCSSTPEVSDIGPLPSNYKELVKAEVKATFLDPYSIRDAQISQPFKETFAFSYGLLSVKTGWVVCLRSNSKNAMGGYTGAKNTAFMIQGGRVVHTVDQHGDHACKPATDYSPIDI